MSEARDVEVSVIIATKDRPNELRTISLPSLAKQTTRAFETIVSDASEDDASRKAVAEFAADHPNCAIQYVRALRPGSASQRNDAVSEARADVVFFIDDDCEVSPDGIAALSELFLLNSRVDAGCLVLEDHRFTNSPEATGGRASFSTLPSALWEKVFGRSFHLAGIGPKEMPIRPGPTDFLSSCDLAVRSRVFEMHRFDERLQKFSGYALWEDQLFSHKLSRDGLELRVAASGKVIHHAAEGTRIPNPYRRGCQEGYNACILWRAGAFPYSRWTVLPFIWSRIGFFWVVFLPCLVKPWKLAPWGRVGGYFVGLSTFFGEEIGRLIRK